MLADTARRFLNGFPGTTMYAVKCNDDPRMLQGLWDGGLRHFDTASLPEIELVRGLFGDAATCHYMHPIKSREAIRAAYFDHGVRSFVVDHPDELAKMAEIVGDLSETIVIVRMEAARHQAVCDLGGKFGADFDTAVRLLRDARALGGRPVTASQAWNTRCPPSSTGTGNRFSSPTAVDSTAMNQTKLWRPCAAAAPVSIRPAASAPLAIRVVNDMGSSILVVSGKGRHLTPVMVMPAMNWRRARRKQNTIGAVMMAAPAISAP